MTVVQELDKTLFDGLVNPKATVIKGIVRDGVLDSNMDWYETPQPTGRASQSYLLDQTNKVDQKYDHICSKY